MEFVNREITITFNITDTRPDITDEEIKKGIVSLLEYYSDGRYPFHVEELMHSTEEVVGKAICLITEEKMRKIHTGYNTIKDKDGEIISQSAKFIEPSNELNKNNYVRCKLEDPYSGEIRVNVKTIKSSV